MVVFRILSGRALLDKLPSWLVLPAGVLLGAMLGYSASMPDASPKRIMFVGAVFVVVITCGLLAPKPTRRGPRRPEPSTGSLAKGDDALDDSLFD